MKLIRSLFKQKRKSRRQSLADYQRELMVRQGREQFENLVNRGLGIPVGLL